MEIRKVWVLRGPNIWFRRPALEAWVVVGDPTARCPAAILARLAAGLPGFAIDPQETSADVVMRLALDLQVRSGSPVRHGRVQSTSEPGLVQVVVEYEEELLGRACLDAAVEMLQAAETATSFDGSGGLARLRRLALDTRLGPSTRAIADAARRRGVPVSRLNEGSLLQLGHACRQRRVWTAETDRTGALAEAIAQDKELTRGLLAAAGVAVPAGRPVADVEDAVAAAGEVGFPCVVKPRFGNQGRGVAAGLMTVEQVRAAHAAAAAISAHVVVERHIVGDDYRLLVIGGRLVAAAFREPAHVVGDGRSSISQLVETANRDPRRSDGHGTALSFIPLDSVSLAVLAEQGLTLDSVPAAGRKVFVRRNANLSTGGTATDVTDRVHPELAERAVEAARVIGLDIAGIDVVAPTVEQPLETSGGAVVEVNAGPGLRMHLEPSAGKPRPVGEAIVDALFPPGDSGRVPIVAVTGVNGKTTTTRLIAHVLMEAGKAIGLACTDGLYILGRRTSDRDCSGPQSAKAVLAHPQVEAAVLETARGGILREGLGFDYCDVAVVTNIGRGDHLGHKFVETPEDLARVKGTLVEAVSPTGMAVLNAADPLVVGMAGRCRGTVAYFAREERLLPAKASGKRAFVREERIVLAEGATEVPLVPIAEVPLTQPDGLPFQVENVLAAALASWCLGMSLDQVRAGLRSFRGGAADAPGRFNVFRQGGSAVILDYAQNPSALAAVVVALDRFPQRRRTLVFCGFNRREIDLIEMGELAGNGFDRVLLYQDRDTYGRADGELTAVFRQGLSLGRRVVEVLEFPTERMAIDAALDGLTDSDVVVIGVERITESLAYVSQRLAAKPGPESSVWRSTNQPAVAP